MGARSLNVELQAALNPADDKKVERFGWTYAPGDKVMQIGNDYDKEVYNGDIGRVTDIDLDEGDVLVDFEGRTVTFLSVSWTRLHPPMRQPYTKARVQSIPPWLFRS